MRERERDILKNSFLKNLESAIKQFQNGNEEMVFGSFITVAVM